MNQTLKKRDSVKNDFNRHIDEEQRTLIRPDIIVKKKGIIVLILDTKYKTSIKDDDLNQMWIYCISLNVSTGILVYPQYFEAPFSRTLLSSRYKILLKNIDLTGNTFEEFKEKCKTFVDDVERCIMELFL
nr:hypothetical protein [Candidatus Nitrosocosmicus franklandus]